MPYYLELLDCSNDPYPTVLPSLDPTISVVGNQCFSDSSSNKSIRLLFLNDFVSIPNVMVYWNAFVSDIAWRKVWLIPNWYLITNKIKEVSFWIIHSIYPVNTFLKKYKKDIDTNCSFCKQHPETVCLHAHVQIILYCSSASCLTHNVSLCTCTVFMWSIRIVCIDCIFYLYL